MGKEKEVLEIGVGGGRIAQHVAPQVSKLHALDISSEMLKKAKSFLSTHQNIE
jgi:ubiquinone/menaquinone biosynthesis C-methylase UbiE